MSAQHISFDPAKYEQLSGAKKYELLGMRDLAWDSLQKIGSTTISSAQKFQAEKNLDRALMHLVPYLKGVPELP